MSHIDDSGETQPAANSSNELYQTSYLGTRVLAIPCGSCFMVMRYRFRSQRSEAVRIAARAYLKHFGEPAPPYCKLPPGRVDHLIVRWKPSRNAYIINFGYQFVGPDTRHYFLGGPIPFASYTVIESFEVATDGGCIYLGHHSGGVF
jgi:hypothetical protein